MTSMRRRFALRHLAVSASAVVLLGACAPRSADDSAAPDRPSREAAGSLSDRLPSKPLLGQRSVWRQDVSAAPINPNSAALVANLAAQVRDHYGGIAALNIAKYSVAFYEVSASTPLRSVTFDDCQGKGAVPPELYDESTNAPLSDVPIPSDARSAAGTDGELSLWSPKTDQLWELWKAHEVGGEWHACFGGRLDDASRSTGRFPGSTGVSASGLALAPAALGIKEVRAGRVEHALSVGVIDAAHYETFSYPATRSDGNQPDGTADAIPEGTRFRLDPSVDIDSLDLTRIGHVVAEAAQRYGFIVTDRSGAVSIGAERGPVDAGRGEKSRGWGPALDGVPAYAQLKNFPWDRLQALPLDYGRPAVR